MVVEFIELSWVEIGCEIPVMLENTSGKSVIHSFGKVMQGQPEKRKSHVWCD